MRPTRLAGRSPEKAFESLYRRHFREIFGYALALLDSPADAEDATQATFLNAYRALEQGERPRHAVRWLRAIALNVCREHFRRASRRPEEVSLEEDPAELVVESPGPAIGDVIRALSHLPFNQRAALVMREFEGRSVTEIASQLAVTSSAVETLLFRARRALREQLEGSLRCDEAERAISRQLDGALPRSERGPLRAHLRQCPECASLARRLRAQGSALKSLALVPAPATLAWGNLGLPGATGAASTATGASLVGVGAVPVALKVVGATVLAALAVGTGYVTLGHHGLRASPRSIGGHAAPSAMTGRVSALAAVRTVRVGSGLNGLNGSTDERRPGDSMPTKTEHRIGARPVTAGSPRVNATGGSPHPGLATARHGGAHRIPTGSGAIGGDASPGHGHGHAGGDGHGRAGAASTGAATSRPHAPTRPPPGHRQSRGNDRSHGLASGQSAGNGHGRAGAATSEPHAPTGPPPGQGQKSGNQAKANPKT